MVEEAVVQAARQGDGEALGELVRRYHGPLLGYLLRLGADRELAQDLAQETFCRVCLRISGLDNPGAFRVWLYRTAHRLFLDHHRSWYRRRVAPVAEPPAAGSAAGPEEEVLRAEEGERVRKALASLRPALRVAVILRHYQQLSLEEIAGVTGVPVGTVKSRLHRAQRILAAELAPPALLAEVGRARRCAGA